MAKSTIFNPFKKNVVELLVEAFESRPFTKFPPESIEQGCGVYAIYYRGKFAPYGKLSHAEGPPIYVGKAVVPGGRKGSGNKERATSNFVISRLKQHAKSILRTSNLDIKDFECRWLLVVPEFTNTAESILIDYYSPIWNRIVPGFGIHDPGKGRLMQARSHWDMLHPGRSFADRLPKGKSERELIKFINQYYDSIKGK